jgi:hypothetical protein
MLNGHGVRQRHISQSFLKMRFWNLLICAIWNDVPANDLVRESASANLAERMTRMSNNP